MAEPEPSKLLFKEKQAKILVLLLDEAKQRGLSELAKEAGATYVHASRFISQCEVEGLVRAEQRGKKKGLFLTDKGKKIASGIDEVLKIMSGKVPVEPEVKQPPAA